MKKRVEVLLNISWDGKFKLSIIRKDDIQKFIDLDRSEILEILEKELIKNDYNLFVIRKDGKNSLELTEIYKLFSNGLYIYDVVEFISSEKLDGLDLLKKYAQGIGFVYEIKTEEEVIEVVEKPEEEVIFEKDFIFKEPIKKAKPNKKKK